MHTTVLLLPKPSPNRQTDAILGLGVQERRKLIMGKFCRAICPVLAQHGSWSPRMSWLRYKVALTLYL